MQKIESYVKTWYDAMEDGKITGAKCKKCGALEFPPVPVCNSCGAHDMEWVEIDGEGTLISCDDCTAPIWEPDLGPVISGLVKLKEGAVFQSFIIDVEDEDRISLFDKLPVRVQAEIQQRDGFKYPCFRIVEDQED